MMRQPAHTDEKGDFEMLTLLRFLLLRTVMFLEKSMTIDEKPKRSHQKQCSKSACLRPGAGWSLPFSLLTSS